MLIIWSIVDCLSRKLLRFTRSVVKAKALANQANLIGLTERLVSYHQQLKSQSSEKLCPLYKTYKVLKKIKPLKGHLNENIFSYLLFLIRITGYAMSKNLLFYRYLSVFLINCFGFLWFLLMTASLDWGTWSSVISSPNRDTCNIFCYFFLVDKNLHKTWTVQC